MTKTERSEGNRTTSDEMSQIEREGGREEGMRREAERHTKRKRRETEPRFHSKLTLDLFSTAPKANSLSLNAARPDTVPTDTCWREGASEWRRSGSSCRKQSVADKSVCHKRREPRRGKHGGKNNRERESNKKVTSKYEREETGKKRQRRR